MPRIRSLKPEFCTSEAIAQLSIPARLHFALLWTYADDEGRGVDHPKLIKAALWPLDDEIDAEQVEKWQAELEEKGRIVRYEVEGKAYFEVVNFAEHQKPQHPVVSKHPPFMRSTETLMRPHEDDSETLQGVVVVVGDVDGEGVQPLVVQKDDRPPPIIRIFQEWKTATNRNGRTLLTDDRKKAIQKALKLGYDADELVDAVRGWRLDPHCRGENDRNTVYNDLELLLRDAKHIEKFRDLERGQGPAPPMKVPKSFNALQTNHERHAGDPGRSDRGDRSDGLSLAPGGDYRADDGGLAGAPER